MHWKLSGLMKKDRRDDVSTLGQKSSSLIMRLPSEILYLIFGHLNDRKDFVALSHTCRIFRALAGKYLYSHVDMVYPLISIFSEEPNSSQSSRYIAHRLNIYQTLAGPSYSGLVTSFEFEFPECYCYSKRKFGSLRAKVIPKCDEVDFQLSNFLPTLPNLHTLKITCRACRTPGIGKRHKYISNLKTTSLKRLCFNCTCSSESIEWTCAVLSAPCLQSVEELDWDQPLEREDGEFQIGNMLPRLQRLDYTRNVILEELLACRPITHLACRVWDDKLQEALRMGSKRLTWLHIGNDAKDIYSWVSDRTEKMSQAGRSLVVGVQSNPKAFRSVSHLGGLCFFYSNATEIIEQMESFSDLQSLESIEVINSLHGRRPTRDFHPFHVDPWDVNLLQALGKAYPKLRMVYLNGIDYHLSWPDTGLVVWRLADSKWERTQVNTYDAVNGTYYPTF